KLTWSFRSSDDVLAAVDRVFAEPGVRRGISHDPDPLSHKAIRTDAPGYVEVWPSIGAEMVEEPDDWTLPVNHASAPAVRVAEQDLIALGHFLIQPQDDLCLAAVLRSPIFEVSEETLLTLAGERPKDQSLIASLRRHAAADEALASVVSRLDSWANEVAFKPV